MNFKFSWLYISINKIGKGFDSVYGVSFIRKLVFDEPCLGAPKKATKKNSVTYIHDLAPPRYLWQLKDRVGLFCLNFWAYESCQRDECRVSLLRTTSATVRPPS